MEVPLRQRQSPKRAVPFFSNVLVRRTGLALVTFILLTTIVSLQWLPRRLNVEEGKPAPDTITAPKTVTYIDEAKTAELRDNAARLVEPVYDPDISVLRSSLDELERALSVVRDVRSTDADDKAKAEELAARLNLSLTASACEALVALSEEELVELERQAPALVQEVMQQGVREIDLPEIREALGQRVEKGKGTAEFKEALRSLASTVLKPNLVLNEVETEKRRQQARESILPVEREILQDTVIVRKGDPVTAEDIQKLRALGLLQRRTRWTAVLGVALMVLLLMGLSLAYLRILAPRVAENDRLLTLLALVAVGILGAGRLFLLAPHPLAGYLFPVATGPLLVAILLDSRLAVLTAGELALLTGIMAGSDLDLAVQALAGSLGGILAVQKVGQRSDLTRAGLFVSSANLLAIWGLGLLAGQRAGAFLTSGAVGILNGLLAAILAIGSLPYLESVFNITTPVKLLELANPSHPLLKRLLLEAPGTYHHSIVVGNLAEAAAEAVGADGLLVRVGSYYHDVGKVKRPEFFIENQLLSPNPHDKMSPSLSALVITSHIKEGLELAREYNLPEVIKAIIREHHGTTLVSYFYHQAAETQGNVQEADFRYEGPIPQSKEAALVMLADSVEAAVRSLVNPSQGKIDGLIRKIIKDRLNDGQLDQSDLTLRDLDRVAQAFSRVIAGIYHPRVEYPEEKTTPEQSNEEGSENHAAQHKQ
ncbi:MAG: cyclic-di-AMP phosphodiesterase PgpH [Bacillota bacterium]|nr:cyclic-di-AMP phosphodiesterase PgpH [Bacillota bacterium]MDK2882767.1 cyclic-di-AMP phosphodiesterase PgpH [Bacillota bacterium]MDK2924345.1 cyclic-di-AMP phosphodiesterase PgpH [Bacillota bacterium]